MPDKEEKKNNIHYYYYIIFIISLFKLQTPLYAHPHITNIIITYPL
jgi:hypothetical protein